jgi:hypothetical protein
MNFQKNTQKHKKVHNEFGLHAPSYTIVFNE